jgi:hypothetical protein
MSTTRQANPRYKKQPFNPTSKIFGCIMNYLTVEDCVKLIRICQSWTGPSAEAFYLLPPYNPKLYSLLLKKDTTHPYNLLIREFIFAGKSVDDLLMGDLKNLLELCTNLVSLRMEGYLNISKMLPNMIEEHIPFLSRLEMPGCFIDNTFMIKLTRTVKSLRHLDVSYTQVSLSTLPLVIRECLYLESLDMTGCETCSEEMVNEYEESEFYLVGDQFKDFQSLITQLSLSNTDVTDSLIVYVTRFCHNLDILLLGDCRLLTDTSMNSIAINCPSLKELDISNCIKISDVGIQTLAIHFSNHSLYGQKQHKIKVTPKNYNYNAFQEYIKPKIKSAGVNLEKINLSGLILLTKTGLCLLADKCPKLHQIRIDYCDVLLKWYFSESYTLLSKSKSTTHRDPRQSTVISANEVLCRKWLA